MNKHAKMVIAVLALFIIGMTAGVAFAEPISAKKYNNKDSIIVKVKDGKKIIKINCTYEKEHKQYKGFKKENGIRYNAIICYEHKDGMQGGKKGWWTSAATDDINENTKMGTEHNETHPVTTVTLL